MLLQVTTEAAQNIGAPVTAYLPVMIFFVVAMVFLSCRLFWDGSCARRVMERKDAAV